MKIVFVNCHPGFFTTLSTILDGNRNAASLFHLRKIAEMANEQRSEFLPNRVNNILKSWIWYVLPAFSDVRQ